MMSNYTVFENKHTSNKAYFISHFLFEMAAVMLGDISYPGMILRIRTQEQDREHLR